MSPRRYDMSKRRASAERTRRRILDATVELHGERGILATSWEDIARRAGVAVGTVYRHFPSIDDLVPACGEISMPRLGLPDAERRRELFAGVVEPRERLRRLVAECYAVYERGDDVVRAVRREPDRSELAAVAESHARIEEAIDADGIGSNGNQAFALIGAAAFSNVRGQLRSQAGQVEADVNGDGLADFRILLSNNANPAAAAFIL